MLLMMLPMPLMMLMMMLPMPLMMLLMERIRWSRPAWIGPVPPCRKVSLTP